MISGYVSL